MTFSFVGNCCYCLGVDWIGSSVDGEWKGHKTTRNYCIKCCNRLSIIPVLAPIENRISSAINYYLATGKRFTQTQVYDRAGTCVAYVSKWHPHIPERVTNAVNRGFENVTNRTLERLMGKGVFTVEEFCKEAEVTYLTMSKMYPELHQRVKDAAKESRRIYGDRRKDNRVKKPSLDEMYRRINNPQRPDELSQLKIGA